MNAKERIINAIICLFYEQPFFGSVLQNFKMNAKSEKSEKILTASVNARGNLIYNDYFIDNLSDDELKYILCHEALHIITETFWVFKDKKPKLSNIASDCIINDICNKAGFTFPHSMKVMKKGEEVVTSPIPVDPDGWVSFKFPDKNDPSKIVEKKYNTRTHSALDLYYLLMEDLPKMKICLGDGSEGGEDGIDCVDEIDVSDIDDLDLSKEERDALREHWKQRMVDAAHTARQAGNLPGFISELVDGLLAPKISWKDKLRNFITNEIPNDFTNKAPGRSFYTTRAWVPSVLKENVNIFVSVDASGSTQPYREMFLSECFGILNSHSQVSSRIIFWDTVVNPDNDIVVTTQTIKKLYSLNLKDISGGTCLSSYTSYLKLKRYNPRVNIILTDGFIESDPEFPKGRNIFVLTPDGDDSIIKGHGEIIRIKN